MEDEPSVDLYDLRVVVERIEGRSICGLAIGDYFDVSGTDEVRIPAGKHFCMYAMQAVFPMISAKQRPLAENDWMARDAHATCPDPDERVVMRIERTGLRRHRAADLT
jgi:uncharacterized repeat protein (TIGR04076 family)